MYHYLHACLFIRPLWLPCNCSNNLIQRQTCIWNLPRLALEVPRKMLPFDSSCPKLSGTETRTIPECVLQVTGELPKVTGVCNLPGMSFTWTMLLENYTVPSSSSRWRAWRWDPAHRRAFMRNGSQPAKINKSVTVHGSPHPSCIHNEGKKNSSKLLLNARKLQSENGHSFKTHYVLGVHCVKQLFLLLTYRSHFDLWLAEKWAKYLKRSQTNCFFKHFFSEIGKSSERNEDTGEPLRLTKFLLILGGKPCILKEREIFCDHRSDVTGTCHPGTLQSSKLLRFTGGWQEHPKAPGSTYIFSSPIDLDFSCIVSRKLNKTGTITAWQGFYSPFCLWPVVWTRVKHTPCTWACPPVRDGDQLPGNLAS